MALIDCPECGRQISTAAEACPGCGHPNRPVPARGSYTPPAGPKCYSCSAAATTKCQRCGTLSCPIHLDSIYVSYGKGGAHELRCSECYSSAMTFKIIGLVVAVIFAIGFFIFFMSQSR